jgi:uncharacterized protein (TIGR02265 family)
VAFANGPRHHSPNAVPTPHRFVVEPGVPLHGDGDVDVILARVPSTQSVKGMFFARLVERVGEAWPRVRTTLEGAPRLGRYVPFVDYPARDHVRMIHAAAVQSFPDAAVREAYRRLGEKAFEDFATSTLGAVMMPLFVDAEGALLRFPDAYALSVPRARPATAASIAPRTVRLVFGDTVIPEYLAGTFEAVVRHYDVEPRIEIDAHPDGPRFDVSWSG